MRETRDNTQTRNFTQTGDNNTMIASAENVTLVLSSESTNTNKNIEIPFGNERISISDSQLLKEFLQDYENTIIKCVKTDFTVPGIDIDLSETITSSYEEKWDIKSLKFRNNFLREIIFNTLKTLNELTIYLSDEYMRGIETSAGLQLIARNESREEGDRLRGKLRPETMRLRYKLRDLYRELHPDDYADLPPFEDSYEKYCEEHDLH